MNKAYIILLNYKGTKDTLECLESLLKLKYENFQIFVIDNSEDITYYNGLIEWAQGMPSSIKTSFKHLVYPLSLKPVDYAAVSEADFLSAARHEKIVLIKADKNKGFAAGNNIALNYIMKFGSEDSFIWLLNNDTIVEKQSLDALVEYANKIENLKTGIIGSKLIYYYSPETIQAVGGKFNETFFISTHEGEGRPVTTPKSDFGTIDYAVGASMFITYKFLIDVGPLSEDYFLYYEELDWSYKAREKGWKTDWCPDSVVYHKEGASIGSSYRKEKSLFSETEIFKSRKIFVKKFYGLSLRFYLSSLLLILNRVRKGNFKAAKAVTKITFTQ
ncbi:glycosyltransferase family 2 protein [Flavobacterium sp. NRK1]|uniref:glycosyltransferase family 2 protein n=1 Tax=Flavobacterium sp. NRK1 TaxID=2954929 RepID=UPI002092864C|nr:glycosyltransferase family 2 protein [Flavobacterium sp. NRK1]MCO6147651.1 glycosyltransferase family 2 protein [Flavobacterium sp. NRK1]